MNQAAPQEHPHRDAHSSFDELSRHQRRRLLFLAFLRTIATVVVIVVAYFLAPLDHPMSAVTITELVLLGLVILAMVGLQIWRITLSNYPTLRAVEAVAFIVPAFLVLFA